MEEQAVHNEDHATATENIKSLFEDIKIYGKTNLDLLKLKAVDKSSDAISSLVSTLVVVITLILFFVILNIGIALWLGDLLGKSYYGFFALAGFYLIAGLILNSMKTKWFKVPVANIMIKKMFK